MNTSAAKLMPRQLSFRCEPFRYRATQLNDWVEAAVISTINAY